MTAISFVYFDVGGVAIKDFSDTNQWERTLDYLGIPRSLQSEVNKIFKEKDDAMCEGKFHLDEYIPLLNHRLNLAIPTGTLLQKYVIANFAVNKGIHELIAETKRKVKVGLLTDMYKDMFNDILKKGLLPPTNWDVIIDSSVVGVRKPYEEIYKIAEEMAGVKPEEILFIDNKQKNLDPAVKRGWQTHRYDSSNYRLANQLLAEFLQNNIYKSSQTS